MSIKRLLIFSLVLAFFAGRPLLFGDTEAGAAEFREGLTLFKQGQYKQAILSFRDIIFNPAAEKLKPDAYFWISKSYLANRLFDDAERSLELFLKNYPNHPSYTEGFYLKGRLLFLQNDYENSIQLLSNFLDRFSTSAFVPNAYHWIGESFYSLGSLDDAALVFRKVVDDYPTSYKVEAARYWLSLIEFKKKENELLKLLKWSHEESLKTVEEFQRREKSYEQAIFVYQRKLSALKLSQPEKDLEIERLEEEIENIKNQNKLLENQLFAIKSSTTLSTTLSTPDSDNGSTTDLSDLTNRMRLLQIKQDALVLKEQILDLIQSESSQ